MFEIIKVNRYFNHGARVTSERTIKVSASLEEVLALAEKQSADVDEVKEEIEIYGITSFKGYMVSKR